MRLPVTFSITLAIAGTGAPGKSGAPRAVPPHPTISITQPHGIAVEPAGDLLITDLAAHRLLRVDARGLVSVVGGTGIGGFDRDGLPARKARLHAPHDVIADTAGNLLVADTYNHRVRRIDRKGILSTLVGDGRSRYRGDGGPARLASLNNPQGLALGRDGSLYIADTYNHVVRRVDPQGRISTFAGSEPGLAGDGGPAVRAQLSLPNAVCATADGAVLISDSGNNRIRRVTPAGTIETVLGTGPGSGTAGAGFGGDGGPAGKAKIFAAADLEVGPAGEIYLSDTGNHRIRRISHGVIETIAGTGTRGFEGDGGPAVKAALSSPQKIALGPKGSLYIVDRANRRVRKVDPLGRIETIWGPVSRSERPKPVK